MRPTLFSDTERLTRWTIAGLLALGALGLQWSMRPWVGNKIPFLFFLPAIVAAAARCGRPAGFFVTGVGFLSALVWLAPPGQ